MNLAGRADLRLLGEPTPSFASVKKLDFTLSGTLPGAPPWGSPQRMPPARRTTDSALMDHNDGHWTGAKRGSQLYDRDEIFTKGAITEPGLSLIGKQEASNLLSSTSNFPDLDRSLYPAHGYRNVEAQTMPQFKVPQGLSLVREGAETSSRQVSITQQPLTFIQESPINLRVDDNGAVDLSRLGGGKFDHFSANLGRLGEKTVEGLFRTDGSEVEINPLQDEEDSEEFESLLEKDEYNPEYEDDSAYTDNPYSSDSCESAEYEGSIGSKEEAACARDKVYAFGSESDDSESEVIGGQARPMDVQQQGALFGRFSHQKATKPVKEQRGMFICYTISEDRTGDSESILMNILAHLSSRCLLMSPGEEGRELPVTKLKFSQAESKAHTTREDTSLNNPTLIRKNQISRLPQLSFVKKLATEENIGQLWEILKTTNQRKAYDRAYAELIELSDKLWTELRDWEARREEQQQREEEQLRHRRQIILRQSLYSLIQQRQRQQQQEQQQEQPP